MELRVRVLILTNSARFTPKLVSVINSMYLLCME